MSQFDTGGLTGAGQPFAFADPYANPFEGFSQAQEATRENLINFYRERGETVTPSGDIITRNAAGAAAAPVTLGPFVNEFNQSQPGAFEQLREALGFDIQNRQAAAERQFNRNNEQIAAYETALGEGTAGILAGTEAGAAAIVEGAQADHTSLLARLDRIENNYVDRTAQDISDTVGGIERRFRTQQRLLETGLKPDGTPMTDAERREFAAQFTQQQNEAVNGAVTTIRSRFNETRAQLGTTLAGLQLQSNQVLAAARQTAEQLRLAGRTSALQFELAGRAQIADLVRSNPESVTSLFSSLGSLFQIATSPGAQNVPSLV